MAKDKADRKREAHEKKKQRGEGTSSSLWAALAVAACAMIICMPQLMKRGPPVPKPDSPSGQAAGDADVHLNFATPPEARPQSCPKDAKAKTCDQDSVSIIIPYLNEEWFRIEATMQSLNKYTDMSLVHEIMWVSDGNKPNKVFRSELEAMNPKVSVHENPKNLGLIVTKMEAARRASGSILMFLEPHVVTNAGWLEPLLNRLDEEPKVLIMPSLDALTHDMKYLIAGYGLWRFEWNLNLIYTNPGNVKDPELPYLSPATSGGIYAIRKDWWDKLELFDPELAQWGGDHVEASHKVWRCGGRIEVHPCSRVGHWFREVEDRPYPVQVETVVKNYKRLAEVWFDDYKGHFYKVKPDAKDYKIGDLTKMKARREALQCKDMAWYIKNVDVELGWEANKICIPGAVGKDGGCGKSTIAAHRRSTVLEAMPHAEYQRWAAKAEAYKSAKRVPCCKAKGRGCKRVCDKGEAPSF